MSFHTYFKPKAIPPILGLYELNSGRHFKCLIVIPIRYWLHAEKNTLLWIEHEFYYGNGEKLRLFG